MKITPENEKFLISLGFVHDTNQFWVINELNIVININKIKSYKDIIKAIYNEGHLSGKAYGISLVNQKYLIELDNLREKMNTKVNKMYKFH